MDLCKHCDGICCLNPPQLYPEEAERIKKAGAEIIGFENDGKIFVAVRPVNRRCPFLKNGKCRIYEERPDACRKFECVNMHTPLSDLVKGEPSEAVVGFVKPYKQVQASGNIAWSRVDAERLGVHIVPIADFLVETAAKDIVDVVAMAIRTFVRAGADSECDKEGR